MSVPLGGGSSPVAPEGAGIVNQLVSVTARADTDGITLTGRWSGGLAATTLGVIGGPIPQSPDYLDEAAADALLAQMRYPRTGPWKHDGACWTARVARYSERGYRQQQAELRDDGTTLPRARYILAQQEAVLPDTPYNRGVIRATAEYIRVLETPDGAP